MDYLYFGWYNVFNFLLSVVERDFCFMRSHYYSEVVIGLVFALIETLLLSQKYSLLYFNFPCIKAKQNGSLKIRFLCLHWEGSDWLPHKKSSTNGTKSIFGGVLKGYLLWNCIKDDLKLFFSEKRSRNNVKWRINIFITKYSNKWVIAVGSWQKMHLFFTLRKTGYKKIIRKRACTEQKAPGKSALLFKRKTCYVNDYFSLAWDALMYKRLKQNNS